MTKTFKGQVKFRSPINKENSFGSWNLSEDTESIIDVEVRANGYGWFEWVVEELDEYEEGSLTFEGDVLTDYDGVFELPEQLLTYLQENGYNVDEMLFL
jgi:hypothetical protein